MKSIKSMESLKHKTITSRQINNLVKKALKDKPIWKPAKGYVYLQDLETGDRFICGNSKGIYINSSPSSAIVVITEYLGNSDNYYLGQQHWGSKTEVKKIKE